MKLIFDLYQEKSGLYQASFSNEQTQCAVGGIQAHQPLVAILSAADCLLGDLGATVRSTSPSSDQVSAETVG